MSHKLLAIWRIIANNSRSRSSTLIHESSFKRFSSKPKNESTIVTDIEILLKDQNDKTIGIRSKSSAELLAHKLQLRLIEQPTSVEHMHKHRVFKLTPFSQLLNTDQNTGIEDDYCQTNNESVDKKVPQKKEVKRISFSTKYSEHDIHVKILTMKKWLKKDIDVRLNITANPNEKKVLDALYKRIQTECKGAHFVRNLVKDTEMKVAVHSTPECKELFIESGNEDNKFDLNMSKIDPNKLLNEEVNLDELLKDK